MRFPAALLLLAPVFLTAQAVDADGRMDEGRLDPAWFGAAASLRTSRTLGFQWLRPGLDLKARSLRLKAWEAPAWLLGPRALKDQTFLQRVEPALPSALDRGLQRGLKGALPVSATGGDVQVVARVADAVGQSDDYMAMGSVTLSFDIKLVDGDTGELLAAFHDTLQGSNAEAITFLFGRWCEDLGKVLAKAVSPSPAPTAAPTSALAPVSPSAPAEKAKAAPPPAPFDLEGALRRIEGLRRDGLLSEAEAEALKKKAAERAR